MSCTYYEFKRSGLFSGDYWCQKKDCRVDSDTYYKYCRNYNYDACPIYKQSQSSSPCFITTITCQILGKNDNDPLLNRFRSFRDNILQKNKQYEDALKEYDVIGPQIANCLINDQDREAMALGLFQHALLPIDTLIQQQEYDTAVEKYSLMTLMLINYYGLKHDYNQTKDKNYGYGQDEFEPTLAGHGYKRVRSKEHNH